MQSNIGEVVDLVLSILTNDPLAFVLVLVGSAVMAVSFGALGYLTLGAVADLFTSDRVGPSPQREGR